MKKDLGKEIKESIAKKLKEIDNEMLTPAFQTKMNTAFNKYKGKLSRADWEVKYKTLYKNRAKGTISEEKFAELMGGEPATFTFGGQTRHVDNFNRKNCKRNKIGEII